MRESSDEVIIMTDDGSYGRKGLVTEGVEDVIKREKVDKCFCIGPVSYTHLNSIRVTTSVWVKTTLFSPW